MNLKVHYETIMNYLHEPSVQCQILYVGLEDGEGKLCEDGIESQAMQLTQWTTLRHQSPLGLSKKMKPY